MTIELSRAVDKKIGAGIAGLEMEISDSVMEELLSAIAEGLQEDDDDRPAGLLLLAMESVARHIDSLRVRSNPGAFGLIEELWNAYEEMLTGDGDEKQCWEIMSAEMKKVLEWQRQSYIEAISGKQSAKREGGTGLIPAVVDLVEQQIAETGKVVAQEAAALKELVGNGR